VLVLPVLWTTLLSLYWMICNQAAYKGFFNPSVMYLWQLSSTVQRRQSWELSPRQIQRTLPQRLINLCVNLPLCSSQTELFKSLSKGVCCSRYGLGASQRILIEDLVNLPCTGDSGANKFLPGHVQVCFHSCELFIVFPGLLRNAVSEPAPKVTLPFYFDLLTNFVNSILIN
jgi:hypothetical protein